MKKFNRLLALLMALMLLVCLCACGQSGGTEDETPTTESTGGEQKDPNEGNNETLIPDGMVQYKVKVIDNEGNPVVGVMIQVCTDETCLMPVRTDDTGVATFAPAEPDAYHANFLPRVPDGYEADAELFYFEGDSTEMTIVLQVVAD